MTDREFRARRLQPLLDLLLNEPRPSRILVAHHHYAQDMYIRLRNTCPVPLPVFNIYDLEREIPLWWDLPAN